MTSETEMTASALFSRAVRDGWIPLGNRAEWEVRERTILAAAESVIRMEKRSQAAGHRGAMCLAPGVVGTDSDDAEPGVITTPRAQLVEILERLSERARRAGHAPEGATQPRRIEHQETDRS